MDLCLRYHELGAQFPDEETRYENKLSRSNMLSGGDFGRLLGRQLELELLDQELECRLRLGVAGQQQFSSVGCRQMDIDHLDGGEFLQCVARGQSGCQACPCESLPRTRSACEAHEDGVAA